MYAIIITINVVHEVQNKYKHKRKAKKYRKRTAYRPTWVQLGAAPHET